MKLKQFILNEKWIDRFFVILLTFEYIFFKLAKFFAY